MVSIRGIKYNNIIRNNNQDPLNMSKIITTEQEAELQNYCTEREAWTERGKCIKDQIRDSDGGESG